MNKELSFVLFINGSSTSHMLLSFLLHKKTLLVEAIMLLDSLTIIRNALNPLDFGLNLIAKPEPD